MKDKIQSRERDLFHGDITDQDIRAAKEIVALIINAMKSYGLYPKNHSIPQNSVARFKTALDKFLENHEELRLVVKIDRFVFQGEVVYQGQPVEENLAFLLFRDGVQWFEFLKGIELDELTGLFEIIKQNTVVPKEAEGDLVTALWEKNFPHLKYDAADILWEDAPMIDFSDLNYLEENQGADGQAGFFQDQMDGSPPEHQEDSSQDEQHRVSSERQENVADIAAVPVEMDSTVWELTPDELKILRQIVWESENPENEEDVLDVLSIILETQENKEDFADILDFLKEEFQNVIVRGEFVFATKFLKNLHNLISFFNTEKPWASKLTEDLFVELTGPKHIELLAPHWRILDHEESEQTTALVQFLKNLHSNMIPALMPIMVETKSIRIQQRMVKIVTALANKNIQPLEKLLGHPEKTMVQRVIYIMGQVKNTKSKQILNKLIYHPSGWIRREAFKALAAKYPEMPQNMFQLIEDSNRTVRQLVLDYLGRRRRESSEILLLDYLENRKYTIKDREHILTCYRVLGKCGSAHSVPFLQSMLFKSPWLSFLGVSRSLHRKGAAIALFELGTEETSEILNMGSKSLFPGIRRACRRTGEKNR